MKTIETVAIVTPEGALTLQLQLPPDILPGEHRIVLVIEEASTQQYAPAPLQAFPWPNWAATSTFRREELYDDSEF
jgi:hypothetical protein